MRSEPSGPWPVNGEPVNGEPVDADAGREDPARAVLARALAACLPDLPDVERARIETQALATLRALVADETVRVRTAMTTVIKELSNVPHDLILQLAWDGEISVSDPVIMLSPLLTTEDLLSLLTRPGSATTATSVARRPGLQERVCDAIALNSDDGAIRTLLANRSAVIREATLDALIARAADQIDWHEPLAGRPHLAPRAAAALSLMVTTHLMKRLAERADLPPATTRMLRRQLDGRLGGAGATPESVLTPAQSLAEARVMQEEDTLTETALLVAIRNGDDGLAIAMLAVAANVPVAAVRHALAFRDAKGLVSLAWRARFSMRIATIIQISLARLPPDAVVRADGDGAFPLSPDQMRWHFDEPSSTGR